MSLTEMLAETIKQEVERRQENQNHLLQKAEAFELLIKRGIVKPEGYSVAPISPLPITSSARKFN